MKGGEQVGHTELSTDMVDGMSSEDNFMIMISCSAIQLSIRPTLYLHMYMYMCAHL